MKYLLLYGCGFILLFSMSYGSSRTRQKPVIVCPSGDAQFRVDTSNYIKYCHFGGAEGNGLDTKPLDVSVRKDNDVTKANTSLSLRVNFDGNLTTGHCWFTLKSVHLDDRKEHRISYMEAGKSTNQKEFEMILSKGMYHDAVNQLII